MRNWITGYTIAAALLVGSSAGALAQSAPAYGPGYGAGGAAFGDTSGGTGLFSGGGSTLPGNATAGRPESNWGNGTGSAIGYGTAPGWGQPAVPPVR